jgi:hypothetical protein
MGLEVEDVFVFGSNEAGRHGKGAAKFALTNYGAKYGVGEGMTGMSYAIPTKDSRLRPVTMEKLEQSIRKFIEFARGNPQYRFLLTPIGTGLAGFSKRDVWRLLEKYGLPDNVVLTSTWIGSTRS